MSGMCGRSAPESSSCNKCSVERVVEGFVLEVNPLQFGKNENFTLEITAQPLNATAKALSYDSGSSTLTLNDASNFTPSGNGLLKGGGYGIVSWTGKSGNQLTGVSGIVGITAGTTIDLIIDYDSVDTGYSGSPEIRAYRKGDPDQDVGLAITSASSWTNGVCTITNQQVTSFTGELSGLDAFVIEVKEDAKPGRRGTITWNPPPPYYGSIMRSGHPSEDPDYTEATFGNFTTTDATFRESNTFRLLRDVHGNGKDIVNINGVQSGPVNTVEADAGAPIGTYVVTFDTNEELDPYEGQHFDFGFRAYDDEVVLYYHAYRILWDYEEMFDADVNLISATGCSIKGQKLEPEEPYPWE